MATLAEFLTSTEVFIVILIAIAICGIGAIYFIVKKIYQKRKVELLETNNTKTIKVTDNRVEVAPVLDQIITDLPSNKPNPVEVTKNVENIGQVIPAVPVVEEEQNKVELINEEIGNGEEKKLGSSIGNIYDELKEQVEVDKKNNELVYTEIEPNAEEAKEEIRKATEELLKTQELQKQELIDLSKFEDEQEENAIISLDELYNKSKVLYEQNEITQYEDEGNEPISLADLEARMNKIKSEARELEKDDIKPEKEEKAEVQKVVKLDDFNTVTIDEAYSDDKIFKSSPIISPIFGIEKNVTTNDIELENTANYEKLDEEIKKTNEFLKSLKELKKKLE